MGALTTWLLIEASHTKKIRNQRLIIIKRRVVVVRDKAYLAARKTFSNIES